MTGNGASYWARAGCSPAEGLCSNKCLDSGSFWATDSLCSNMCFSSPSYTFLGSSLGAGVGAGVGGAWTNLGAATGAALGSAAAGVGVAGLSLNKSSTSKCGEESSFFSSCFGYSVNFYPAT